MSKQAIIVVEDEPSILDTVSYALEAEGYAVEGCGTAAEGLAELKENGADLVVLDIGLPDQNGLDAFRDIRIVADVPVIFLTARDSETDRIVGLEIGADDYVTKPFSPRELCARVRAVLRRCGDGDGEETVATTEKITENTDGFFLDEKRARISLKGNLLDLSATEYRLLSLLTKHPGQVFSRVQLMDAVWEDPLAAMERTVDAHIKSLRAKLRSSGATSDPIITHRGMGYSFAESWKG